jgi:hypothetical protein
MKSVVAVYTPPNLGVTPWIPLPFIPQTDVCSAILSGDELSVLKIMKYWNDHFADNPISEALAIADVSNLDIEALPERMYVIYVLKLISNVDAQITFRVADQTEMGPAVTAASFILHQQKSFELLHDYTTRLKTAIDKVATNPDYIISNEEFTRRLTVNFYQGAFNLLVKELVSGKDQRVTAIYFHFLLECANKLRATGSNNDIDTLEHIISMVELGMFFKNPSPDFVDKLLEMANSIETELAVNLNVLANLIDAGHSLDKNPLLKVLINLIGKHPKFNFFLQENISQDFLSLLRFRLRLEYKNFIPLFQKIEHSMRVNREHYYEVHTELVNFYYESILRVEGIDFTLKEIIYRFQSGQIKYLTDIPISIIAAYLDIGKTHADSSIREFFLVDALKPGILRQLKLYETNLMKDNYEKIKEITDLELSEKNSGYTSIFEWILGAFASLFFMAIGFRTVGMTNAFLNAIKIAEDREKEKELKKNERKELRKPLSRETKEPVRNDKKNSLIASFEMLKKESDKLKNFKVDELEEDGLILKTTDFSNLIKKFGALAAKILVRISTGSDDSVAFQSVIEKINSEVKELEDLKESVLKQLEEIKEKYRVGKFAEAKNSVKDETSIFTEKSEEAEVAFGKMTCDQSFLSLPEDTDAKAEAKYKKISEIYKLMKRELGDLEKSVSEIKSAKDNILNRLKRMDAKLEDELSHISERISYVETVCNNLKSKLSEKSKELEFIFGAMKTLERKAKGKDIATENVTQNRLQKLKLRLKSIVEEVIREDVLIKKIYAGNSILPKEKNEEIRLLVQLWKEDSLISFLVGLNISPDKESVVSCLLERLKQEMGAIYSFTPAPDRVMAQAIAPVPLPKPKTAKMGLKAHAVFTNNLLVKNRIEKIIEIFQSWNARMKHFDSLSAQASGSYDPIFCELLAYRMSFVLDIIKIYEMIAEMDGDSFGRILMRDIFYIKSFVDLRNELAHFFSPEILHAAEDFDKGLIHCMNTIQKSTVFLQTYGTAGGSNAHENRIDLSDTILLKVINSIQKNKASFFIEGLNNFMIIIGLYESLLAQPGAEQNPLWTDALHTVVAIAFEFLDPQLEGTTFLQKPINATHYNQLLQFRNALYHAEEHLKERFDERFANGLSALKSLVSEINRHPLPPKPGQICSPGMDSKHS